MRINISSNFEGVAAKFDALNTEMMDATQPLRAFGAIMQKDIGDQFESEGGAFGEPWQPLKHETILRRERKNMRAVEKRYGKRKAHGLMGQAMAGVVPILRDTGILFGSIRQLDLTQRSVTIGTDLIYASTHQYGDKKRNIPKRQFIPEDLSDDEEAQLMNLFESWMQEAVSRSGLT